MLKKTFMYAKFEIRELFNALKIRRILIARSSINELCLHEVTRTNITNFCYYFLVSCAQTWYFPLVHAFQAINMNLKIFSRYWREQEQVDFQKLIP